MEGGIDAWNGLVSRAEVDQGVYLIEGNEPPEEVISLAYGLEEGALRFYRTLSGQSNDTKTSGLFEKLSEAEIQHKEKLWEKYRILTGGRVSRKAFESEINPKTMEGGKTADQVLGEYPDWIQDPLEALQLAMSFETDALDLYLRIALKSHNEDAREVFQALASEEKAHLRRMGELLRGKFPSVKK
jgi:rubrerythrin